MRAPLPRERRLSRARWAEVGASVVALLGLPLGLLRPELLVPYLGALTVSTMGLMFWQYRVMDEFRRARFLKAWAAAGAVGLAAVTALIVWAVALLAPVREAAPAVSIPLRALYLPWLAMLATFFGVTAYLYRRDTRS